MTSTEIKHALMYYFRFKRQWLCASECLNNDVMAITNKDIIDVEIKISKYDLWKGEAKKSKHNLYKIMPEFYKTFHANRFYICVPLELEEEAKKWVAETNKKYGIIIYHPDMHYINAIFIKKPAKTLIDGSINKGLERHVMMRVCSENIGLINTVLLKRKNFN